MTCQEGYSPHITYQYNSAQRKRQEHIFTSPQVERIPLIAAYPEDSKRKPLYEGARWESEPFQ